MYSIPGAVQDVLDCVYPRPFYTEAHKNRTVVIQKAFPNATDAKLPKGYGEWIYQIGKYFIDFRLLPPHENRGRGAARFQVRCPACSKWCSVGKFMLHAEIHKTHY